MKQTTTLIRTVAALRKAAANRRAVTGWSAAKPDVEKPAAWVLRMPFDRVTEALERGMAIYVPKMRKGEKVKPSFRLVGVGEVLMGGDEYKAKSGWRKTYSAGRTVTYPSIGLYRRPIGKGSK